MALKIEEDNLTWNNVPALILVSTFKFLSNQDRLNASLVCRHWLHAFESPALWQEVEFVVDGDLVDDSKRALEFIRKHASSVKCLKLQFRRCRSQRVDEVLTNIQLLFEQLACYGDLGSFEIENFSFHQNQDISQMMMSAFKSFLGSQRKLWKVRLLKTCFDQEEGLNILNILISHNKQIKCLGLWHFFEQDVDIAKNSEWQRLLMSISNPENLELDYYCLSENTLDILCQKEKLIFLSVLCDLKESFPHIISSNRWKIFKLTSPQVSIKYEMVEVVTFQQFLNLMPETTCVNEFTYKCGFSLSSDLNLRRHGVSILQYLGYSFENSLRKLSLDFGFVNIPTIEDVLSNLIMTCRNLEKLSLAGVLSPSLAKRICEIVLSGGRRLKNIYLMFYFSNFESLDEMNQMKEYQRRMKARKIKFHFNLLTFQAIE